MKNNKNVLLTSVGRRGVLVNLFKRELGELFPLAKVFATDQAPHLSAGCHLADQYFEVPHVTSAEYIDRLVDICQTNEIGLIVPTIDTELQVLADNKAALEYVGTIPIISSAGFVQICRDKRRTHDYFIQKGIKTPAIVNPCDSGIFPLFAKPYDGSCSVDTHLVQARSDITPALLDNPKIIFQNYLSHEEHDEFTVDMYFDRNGQLRCLVPRLRLETRAGEVSKGKTIWDLAFESLRKCFAEIGGARGCLTVQFFVNRKSRELYGIEINPRFGGGYPLSYEAGANYPKWLLQEYLQEESKMFFDSWEKNLTMLRYDDHVLVRD